MRILRVSIHAPVWGATDHLPQYDGVSVEMADCLIRIFDFVGGFGLKTAGAMADKIEYNANRADHKIENRLKDNGKKY